VAFKFGEWWQSFVVLFGATDVSVKTLVGGGVEGMSAASANSTFDQLCIRDGDTSMVAIAGDGAQSREIRGGNFLVTLFNRKEGFARTFYVVRCQWCTVTSESAKGFAGIRRPINDVALADVTDIGED
jgi:hypothetical protein